MDIPSELIKAERLIAAGQLEEAKAVLRGILAQDKRNAAAWYLVAQSVADPRAKAEALRRTLLTEPDHPRAKREFEAMDGLAILQPPSMAKPTPAVPSVPPNKVLEDAAPKRGLPLVPLLISGGVVLVVVVVLIAGRGGGSADNVARSFIHAVLNNDENAAMNALSNDSRAQTAMFCSPPFVACLAQRLPVPPGTQDIGAALLNQSGQGAVAQVRLRFPNSPTNMCASVQMQNEGGWKVVDTLGGVVPCGGVQAALVPTQPASAHTTPLDATGQAAMQTATQLAVTRNALLVGPTLTATFLAPGFTQTALVREQDSLNTVIAATQTQAIVLVTQAAQLAGLTSTSIAQTQTAATAMQQAVAFKALLKGTIATSRTVNGQPHIVLMAADGSNVKVLDEIGVDPAWSPDGKQIAYTNQAHRSSIHVMAADGTQDNELPINDAPFGTGWATWAADGSKLMLEGSTRLGLHAVFVSAVNGANVSQILDDSHSGGWTSWSPDGKQILYVNDDQIWVVPLSGGTPHSLGKQPGARAALWSPDGKQIVFDAGNNRGRGIYVMNADGSNLRRITSKNVYVGLPAWSPDNTQIAALCNDNLCMMNADGTSLTLITTDGGYHARIAWFGTPKTVSAQVQATLLPTIAVPSYGGTPLPPVQQTAIAGITATWEQAWRIHNDMAATGNAAARLYMLTVTVQWANLTQTAAAKK